MECNLTYETFCQSYFPFECHISPLGFLQWQPKVNTILVKFNIQKILQEMHTIRLFNDEQSSNY